MAFATGSGAAAQPSRQPVMANPLEQPLTVMVRSRIPGSAPNEAGTPSKAMYS